MNIDKNILSLSIIDIIGEMDDGLAILFNLLINNTESYEILLWYNKNGLILLEPEKRFLEKLNVDNIYEYDKFETLSFYMYSSIPKPDELILKYIK